MNKNLFRYAILILIAFLPIVAFAAKKKTVHVIPENAKIFMNGSEVATGTYDIKFNRNQDFVMLKFEAPGYIERTLKLFKNDPRKTVSYELFEDEAYINSLGAGDGVDMANRSFTITCKKGMSEDVVWKRMMNIAINNFGNVEVRDKEAAWIRTAWVNSSFMYQTVRTRLEIKMQFTGEDELSYQVIISSEIGERDCGFSDQCFIKYERLLRKYENVITELQTSLGSNL